jgi:membrane fusion protein, multidrug efflux system
MKNLRISLIVIMIAVLSASCSKKTSTGAATENIDTTVYPVKTILFEKQKVSRVIDYTANLLAWEEVNYAPAAPGRVEEIFVEVGSHVAKGDAIARMDRTQLNQAAEQLQSAKTNFERMDTLYKLKSMSEQQYEASKTQYEVAKTNYDFLNRNTTLLSPISGIVTGKYFERGELYSGAPNTSAGKAAIVTLMQINPLKATINITERYYPVIKKGMNASVNVEIYPKRKFSGVVFRVYPTISSDTRTFPVELQISNSDETLRPGMFARVLLDLGEADVMVLPAVAVMKMEGTNDRYVYKVNADNTASKIPVTIGERYDDKLEIISDAIREGDRIISAGQEKLLDGSHVNVVQ